MNKTMRAVALSFGFGTAAVLVCLWQTASGLAGSMSMSSSAVLGMEVFSGSRELTDDGSAVTLAPGVGFAVLMFGLPAVVALIGFVLNRRNVAADPVTA